jgi:hypothetical protein
MLTIQKTLLLILPLAMIVPICTMSGCGVSFQGSGSSSASSSSTTSSSTTSSGEPQPSSPLPTVPLSTAPTVQPVPGSFTQLTGCTNPNTGTSNNDWGVGVDPVYTAVNGSTPVVETGTYTSNTVFWISRETAPGQSVLMTGAFTNANKTVRVAPIPVGTTNWQPLVQTSPTIVPATQQGTTGLSFIIPPNFPAGAYGFQIEDPSAPSVFGIANVPAINWVIGMPSVTDATVALQHQVYDCGAEAGEVLRIFGKNFSQATQVFLQSSNNDVYPLTPSSVDTNSISAAVPSSLPTGTYTLWVGSSPWNATASSASHITIYPAPSLSVSYATCPGLVGDGKTDNTALLQRCLDANAPVTGSNRIVQITIPAGNFLLSGAIAAHPYEILIGSSSTSTVFTGQPNGPAPNMWFTFPQHFGMAHLSFYAPANPYLAGMPSASYTGNPQTSGHVFIDDVDFQSTSGSAANEFMFSLAGPDIQIYNSEFLAGSSYVFSMGFADGAVLSGNKIILNNWTGLGFADSQNVIFEHNAIYSQNTPGQGAGGYAAGAGLEISRANSQYGPSALSQDIYVGYNTFDNVGSRGQQVVTVDGDGGSYFGPIASSTPGTVVLADDPAWNWLGTTNPSAASIVIVTGTGMGQYSMVSSYSGRTINLVTPWKVLPDSTSVLVISQYELNLTIAHNTMTNTLGTSLDLSDALEGVIEDNTFTNSGDGILIAAFGPYGGPAAFGPVMNTDVLRNTIAVGAGNFITPSTNTNLGGIQISDFPGCLISGLLIRDNVVPSKQTMSQSDGWNLISGTLIEQNNANWVPGWDISGILAQDNTSQ